MSIIRLGKLHLHWCRNCNVPLVESGNCGICSTEGEQVKITPPGDVRPAFKSDKGLLKDTVERQWGGSYLKKMIGEKEVVLLNSSPHLDRMDEVIVDGRVIGNLRYNIYKREKGKEPYEFLIRPWKGLPTPEEGYVIVDEGAVEPILNGASILAPGIIDVDDGIRKGDEVMILDEERNVISTGPAQMDAEEMIESDYGKALKNRWRVTDFTVMDNSPGWKKVLKANQDLIDGRVEEAVDFIKRKIDMHEIPPVVAYSGGKDSLATLHLVLDSDIKPDLLFIDTGIELPETIENVKNTADKHDLKLVTKKARSGYWNNVDHFGPSARDYRWCCKTCKLGPTALLIDEEYPDGVLSFIGQRRYESKQRMDQGNTWDNPWVPGQKSASPIQDWTALHVWMYLFRKNAEYNPLYEKGFERIGCWLCPASDLAEFESLKERFDNFEELDEIIEEYKEKADLPEIWKELGLWRWIDIPENMKTLLKKLGKQFKPRAPSRIPTPSTSEMLKDKRTRNLLDIILPKEEKMKSDNISVEEFYDILDGNRLSEEDLFNIYIKAQYCSECGICLARCPNDALVFDDGIKLIRERCNGCRSCLGKCPVVEFDERVFKT